MTDAAITNNGHASLQERPDEPIQAERPSTAHIGELAGFILRTRQHLIETEKETSWRGRHLEEAEQTIREWANSFISREKAATQRKAKRAEADANKLERVVARQTSSPRKSLAKGLGAALRGRMLTGQARDEATEAVLAQCRALLDATADPTPRAPRTPKKQAQPDA